jgi:hypothetical protein
MSSREIYHPRDCGQQVGCVLHVTCSRHANTSSNGNTPGITLPGVQGQEDVIRKAYASARLNLEDTVYVEVRQVRAILRETSTLTSM